MLCSRASVARATSVAVALLAVYACRDVTAPLSVPLLAPRSETLLPGPGVVSVTPDSMRGWSFSDDQHSVPCPNVADCSFVADSAGRGSAELAVNSGAEGNAIGFQGLAGVRLDRLTELRYSTFRQTADPGNNLAIALQLNVDYDVNDQSFQYQGRLVFEPYQGIGGNVPQRSWQRWDTKAGKWWGTKSAVRRGDLIVTNACVQATPCT